MIKIKSTAGTSPPPFPEVGTENCFAKSFSGRNKNDNLFVWLTFRSPDFDGKILLVQRFCNQNRVASSELASQSFFNMSAPMRLGGGTNNYLNNEIAVPLVTWARAPIPRPSWLTTPLWYESSTSFSCSKCFSQSFLQQLEVGHFRKQKLC